MQHSISIVENSLISVYRNTQKPYTFIGTLYDLPQIQILILKLVLGKYNFNTKDGNAIKDPLEKYKV